jgi:Integrase core domain
MTPPRTTTTTTDAKRQVVEEIHRPARINFKRRKVVIKSLFDLYQADLVDMQLYAKENAGYKYILVVINCFSKFVWAYPLKTKTGLEVTKAMEKVLIQQSPKNLQTDAGLEFFNKDFKKLMTKYKINHYNVYSEKKASIVERVNRTLKNMMWKEFSLQGHYKWINLLSTIVENYNNKKHRTIKMKPRDVTKNHEKKLLDTVYNRIKISELNNKFKVGDFVRISKIRGVFDKKYQPNWSTEIFTVRKVQLTNPTTYLLKDENNQEILGGFYREQLQKVKFHDVYLVEKVLKRRGNKIYVKWLGFKKPTWIHKSNIA